MGSAAKLGGPQTLSEGHNYKGQVRLVRGSGQAGVTILWGTEAQDAGHEKGYSQSYNLGVGFVLQDGPTTT